MPDTDTNEDPIDARAVADILDMNFQKIRRYARTGSLPTPRDQEVLLLPLRGPRNGSIVRRRMDQVARQTLRIFPALLALGMPVDDIRIPWQVESVVRRTIVSALMQKEFEPEALRETFEGVLAGR